MPAVRCTQSPRPLIRFRQPRSQRRPRQGYHQHGISATARQSRRPAAPAAASPAPRRPPLTAGASSNGTSELYQSPLLFHSSRVIIGPYPEADHRGRDGALGTIKPSSQPACRPAPVWRFFCCDLGAWQPGGSRGLVALRYPVRSRTPYGLPHVTRPRLVVQESCSEFGRRGRRGLSSRQHSIAYRPGNHFRCDGRCYQCNQRPWYTEEAMTGQNRV